MAEQGGSPFTGDRMMYVILTLPYMIRDIACSERRQINAAIRSASQGDTLHGAPLVEDPCEKIVETRLDILRWFLLIRRKELSTKEIVKCIERGTKMMESLKETFFFRRNEDRILVGNSESFTA